MLRESGFYWVRLNNNNWIIAEWVNSEDTFDSHWDLCGTDNMYDDNTFKEIGPRIIKE